MRHALRDHVEAWYGRDNALDQLIVTGVYHFLAQRVSDDCYLVKLETDEGPIALQFLGMADKPVKARIIEDP